jgi:hypothetical protein
MEMKDVISCLQETNTGWINPARAHYCPRYRLSIPSDLAVAVAAIYRSVATWFEGYFCTLATRGTGHSKHLASSAKIGAAAASVSRGSFCLTASGTALGLVEIAPGLEQFLLICAKCKASSTISTCEGLVLVTH